MVFKLGMTVDDGIYAHVRVDNLDLDARSQWLAEDKIQC